MAKSSKFQGKVIKASDYLAVSKLIKTERSLLDKASIYCNPIFYVALTQVAVKAVKLANPKNDYISVFNDNAKKNNIKAYEGKGSLDFDFNEDLKVNLDNGKVIEAIGLEKIVADPKDNLCLDLDSINYISRFMCDTEDQSKLSSKITNSLLEKGSNKVFQKADELGLLKDAKGLKTRSLNRNDAKAILKY